jgi:signal transduction histidine kinase
VVRDAVAQDRGRSGGIEPRVLADARRTATHRVAFLGHGVVYVSTSLLLLVVTNLHVTGIVALSWGIGLAAHGFFGVVGPALRRRWIEGEVQGRLASGLVDERRALEGKHARSLELLSASIAHEIRQPITAAKSLVQQMGEDPSSPENLEYAKVALEELDRVERSVSHLLRFAREEELAFATVRIEGVVDAALETVRARLEGLGVEVVRKADPSRPLHGDADKLRQVVLNLVGNALDALEEAGTAAPRLEIGTGQNLAGTEVWLRVRDNGPGIAPDALARVWSPLATTKAQGTGLGLAITRKIVEGHHGTIEARSEPGQGTELLVVLPASPATTRGRERS